MNGIGLKLPLVVRLEVDNLKRGKKTLATAGQPISRATTMADAARKVVQAAASHQFEP